MTAGNGNAAAETFDSAWMTARIRLVIHAFQRAGKHVILL
jgi:hypothetical protein